MKSGPCGSVGIWWKKLAEHKYRQHQPWAEEHDGLSNLDLDKAATPWLHPQALRLPPSAGSLSRSTLLSVLSIAFVFTRWWPGDQHISLVKLRHRKETGNASPKYRRNVSFQHFTKPMQVKCIIHEVLTSRFVIRLVKTMLIPKWIWDSRLDPPYKHCSY